MGFLGRGIMVVLPMNLQARVESQGFRRLVFPKCRGAACLRLGEDGCSSYVRVGFRWLEFEVKSQAFCPILPPSRLERQVKGLMRFASLDVGDENTIRV